MTNKEAKDKLYMEWQKYLENYIDYAGVSKAYKVAFKSLDQEINLDKIRAEIAAIDINGRVDEHTLFIRTGEQVKQMVLDIIDKYKSKGSEENEESD